MKGKRVLELGAGTALPGLLAAKLGCQVTELQEFSFRIQADFVPLAAVILLTNVFGLLRLRNNDGKLLKSEVMAQM